MIKYKLHTFYKVTSYEFTQEKNDFVFKSARRAGYIF